MPEMVKEAYVTVEVSNMARAIRFYTKVLGLKLEKNYKGYWADVKAPGLWIGLHAWHEGGARSKGSGNLSIGFTPADIGKAVSSLRKKGVKVKLEQGEWGRYAGFKDPDGTDLYFWTDA